MSIKIYIDGEEKTNNIKIKNIVEHLKSSILKINDILGFETEAEINIYTTNNNIYMYDIIIDTPDGDGVLTVEREIYDNKLIHKMFYVEEKYRRKGLSKPIMELSLNVVDELELDTITLNAGLEDGGYVWLRKGAFPDNTITNSTAGQNAIEVTNDGTFKAYIPAKNKILAKKFKKKVAKLNNKQLQTFFLSDQFKEYSSLFSGATWSGSFDINDDVVRLAMRDGAKDAYNLIERKYKTINGSVNELIHNKTIKNQVNVLRFAKTLSDSINNKLKSTNSKLEKEVIYYLTKLDTRLLISAKAKTEFKKLQDSIVNIRGKTWKEIYNNIKSDLIEFAHIQAETHAKIVEDSFIFDLKLNRPSKAHLLKIIKSQPIRGKTLKDWVKKLSEDDLNRLISVAKLAITDGKTPIETSKLLFGKTNSAVIKTQNDIETVLLTLTNAIQNEVKQSLYNDNKDVISKEIFFATLDNRTTLICASNDHKVFSIGKGPMPPLHFRCRSVRVPYIEPELLTTRGYNAASKKLALKEFNKEYGIDASDYNSLPYGYKKRFNKFFKNYSKNKIGALPANISYEEWLRAQPIEFQDEVLGIEKAKLFRNGLALDKFVTKDGDVLTLKELREKKL